MCINDRMSTFLTPTEDKGANVQKSLINIDRDIMKYISIALLSGLITVSATASEVDQHKVKSCQSIVDQLEQNKDLKRQGGSSSYKNSLRKKRQALDKKYGQLQCYMVKEYLDR